MHTIRLRDPWQFEQTDAAAVWRRKFNRPTNLHPNTPVWLKIETACPLGGAHLNGTELSASSPETAHSWRIEHLLTPANVVALQLPLNSVVPDADRVPGPLVRSVTLQIDD
jgi:hypothetical protein